MAVVLAVSGNLWTAHYLLDSRPCVTCPCANRMAASASFALPRETDHVDVLAASNEFARPLTCGDARSHALSTGVPDALLRAFLAVRLSAITYH